MSGEIHTKTCYLAKGVYWLFVGVGYLLVFGVLAFVVLVLAVAVYANPWNLLKIVGMLAGLALCTGVIFGVFVWAAEYKDC
jgi:hypothetical protein